MIAVEEKVKQYKIEYKSEIQLLEKQVKKWKKELLLKEIGKLASECYESFNDLNMNIAKLKELKLREKYTKEVYKETYKFLVFMENTAIEDVYCLLVNQVKPFSRLITHYNKYCSSFEKKNDIELSSEKKLRD